MTQFDLFYYWPVIQWDFWIGLAAIVGCVAVNLGWAYKVTQQPMEVLTKYGYPQANKDSAWAVLIIAYRYVAAYKVMVSAFGLYFWYVTSMRYSVWFLFCMEAPIAAITLWRAYKEDEKNGMMSKVSKENSKDMLKTIGGQVGLLAFAGTFLWFEFYNGTNYVKDAKHGLPEELTMMLSETVGVVRNRFLKGH